MSKYGEYLLKIGVFARTWSVWTKISGTWGCPHQPFLVLETKKRN